MTDQKPSSKDSKTSSGEITNPDLPKKIGSTVYRGLNYILAKAAEILAPPRRITVSQAAEKHRKLSNPPAYIGDWKNDMNPPFVEPMDELTSRYFKGLVFVGPAQCGKTDSLILNYILYSVVIDPMDIIVYCPTNSEARDFSSRRIDRLHRHSPDVGGKMLRTRDADNKFDKHYSSGMMLTLSWPSASTFAGKPIPRVVITDYDRMDDDIEGEGSPFDLANKRTTSYQSFGMTVAESSPSRNISDPRWVRRSKHEAPPTTGILSLYNRGDRRRWYWPCPKCSHYFEGNFRHLDWDRRKGISRKEAGLTAVMVCPAADCDYRIKPQERNGMQLRGHWVKDGQTINKRGVISGTGPETDIASFWLNGAAATFMTWSQLVDNYLTAEDEFQRTGTETSLQKFYNTDLGEPYTPKSVEVERLPEALAARAEPIAGTKDNPMVPLGTAFIAATIDVQQNMFKVQVHAIQPGTPHDVVVMDRFDIRLSDGSDEKRGVAACKEARLDEDGQVAWVKPGTFQEDWDIIIPRVIDRTYPLADGSGRRMAIKITGCDSGGKAGVTSNAYAFYRKLRTMGRLGRFALVKGDPLPSAGVRVKITYPDSSNRNNMAAAQGDVPVHMLASNQLKDAVSNRLDSLEPGKGMIRFADWLEDWFYEELTSETRTDKGWVKRLNAKNEAWDLLYYCLGICLAPGVKVEAIDWKNPPAWAAAWDKNNMISKADEAPRFTGGRSSSYDFGRLGRQLAS